MNKLENIIVKKKKYLFSKNLIGILVYFCEKIVKNILAKIHFQLE